MINPRHFKKYVIAPVLAVMAREHTAFGSEAAANLLLGTAVQESRLDYIKQINGPALGFFQVEPLTLEDCYDNFLDFGHNERIRDCVDSFIAPALTRRGNLLANPTYGCAIARIKYWRHSAPLPDPDDVQGLAEYYKSVYNTSLGKATVQEFVENYKRYC